MTSFIWRVFSLAALAWLSCLPATLGQGGMLETLVKTEAILDHLTEFERIANLPENEGSRAVYLGHRQSGEYILNRLAQETDYDVIVQELDVTLSLYTDTPVLRLLKPVFTEFELNTDFLGYLSAGSGTVNAAVNPVRGGCQQSDFADFPSGTVALLNRGTFTSRFNSTATCAYRTLIDNAVAAGAAGVLVYNPDDFLPMLGGTNSAPVPVFGISSSLATYLNECSLAGEIPIVRMVSETEERTIPTFNILAETKSGRADSKIVIGSHLDSVPQGPGINDNGSGSATILEAALQFGKLAAPVNKVQFSWWTAEEYGLLGSQYYVDHLTSTELNNIAVNLNFDMIGSPNYIRGIFNGREASEDIRAGCTAVQELFEAHFDGKGLQHQTTPFNGRSDYGPFIEVGIPAGGLFSGAEEKKTVAQRNMFGGSANVALDSCYHLSCDSVSNISPDAITELAGAAMSILETLAFEEDLRGFLGGSKRHR